ncbi:MAG: DUF4330 domain-containing protein [Tissierellia bacterium]|nr:DUF4330 domain-containing protein [Tissierellia bacterium]
MKIINEKGKLFGIINLIDLLVLLLVAIIIVGGVKRFKNKPVVAKSDVPATLTYEISDIRDITVNQIQVGDPLFYYDRGGFLGTITSKEVKPYKKPVEYNGTWVDAEVPEKFTVVITIEAMVKDSDDVFVAGGEQTRVGVEMRMKNKRAAFFATCLNIELSQLESGE